VELFEAKWTEVAASADAVNLEFVRNVVGTSRIAGGAVISRTPNGYPFANGFWVMPVTRTGIVATIESPLESTITLGAVVLSVTSTIQCL